MNSNEDISMYALNWGFVCYHATKKKKKKDKYVLFFLREFQPILFVPNNFPLLSN